MRSIFGEFQEQLLTGSGNLFEMRNGDGVCGILTSSVKLRPCSLLLYVPSFYLCQCANVVDRQCLCLWHIDVTKDDNMCERCFWIKEISLFFRDFEPISLFRDTSKW
ncbi:unnamed protein product [Brassica rapa subsp. trilocularis]